MLLWWCVCLAFQTINVYNELYRFLDSDQSVLGHFPRGYWDSFEYDLTACQFKVCQMYTWCGEIKEEISTHLAVVQSDILVTRILLPSVM